MNRIISRGLILILLCLSIFYVAAQPDHFAYAVTSINKGGNTWVALRKLDLRTTQFSNPMTMGAEQQSFPDSSVAALAYDRTTNRVYYTNMNEDLLRYLDLFTMQSYAVAGQSFSKAGRYDFRNAGPINRMVIAPDGYGYTVTNDGTHLLRFTTYASPVITDLGDLQDDPQNKEFTIHSICANSGGDLIADDDNHLFLITGTNKVFKIDLSTHIAVYQGTISGLTQKFTTSGAAVSDDGKKILLSSAAYADAFFFAEPYGWTTVKAKDSGNGYETADLANSNVLFAKPEAGIFPGKIPETENRIRVFPNPVMDDRLSVQFNNLPPGLYTIQLADLLGNKVMEQKTTVVRLLQTDIMHIPLTAPQGFYTVRILDDRNNIVSTIKLIIERW